MKYKGISILKNKKCSTWYARYRSNGKQFYISAKTQKECYNKLKKELIKRDKERIYKEENKGKNTSITFIEWFNKWLKLYKPNVKEGTLRDYNYSLKYIQNIQTKYIDNINSLEILELLSTIKFERTKQKVYELLNDIFYKAKINKLIIDNPMEIIDKPKYKRINGLAISNKDEKVIEEYLIKNNYDYFQLNFC